MGTRTGTAAITTRTAVTTGVEFRIRCYLVKSARFTVSASF
jgi:hypothetical protein